MTLLALARSTPAACGDLVVWSSYDADEKAGLEKLVETYNAHKGAAGPHVTLVHVLFDVMGDRIAGAVPRGKGPDVFIYPQDRLGGWVEAGNVIAPIGRLVDPDVRERFIPAAVQALTYRGELYALPFNLKFIALFYNKKLVPDPPRTTAALAVMAKRLTNHKAGTYGFTYLYNNYWWHGVLQNGFGGRIFDRLSRPVLDSPENVKAMELLLRWKESFLPEDATREFSRALFNQGKLAMILEGPWFIGEVSKSIDYGVAVMPSISEANNQPMRPWMTVDGIFTAAPSLQKEAAYDFAKYITSMDAAKVMALEGAQMPANQRVYLDPSLAGNPVVNAFFRQALSAVPMPNVPEMTVMWSPMFVAMNLILTKAATPEAALAKAQEQVAKGVDILHGPARPPLQ
jgi:arabinogalactan oligomer/maltooligosaccharide transport system substrate-binding protein